MTHSQKAQWSVNVTYVRDIIYMYSYSYMYIITSRVEIVSVAFLLSSSLLLLLLWYILVRVWGQRQKIISIRTSWVYDHFTWWRHQMETFSALLAICAGNSPASGEFPAQRPVTRSFDVFFDLRLNKRLRKQSRCWWFETLSCPLWRHRNETEKRRTINT